MIGLDASNPYAIEKLPTSSSIIVVLEGMSLYWAPYELHNLLYILQQKYKTVHVLMDVYTLWGAYLSRYKNPIREVGVNQVYGIKNIDTFLQGTSLKWSEELSLGPNYLVDELPRKEKFFFNTVFSKALTKKMDRLYALESIH